MCSASASRNPPHPAALISITRASQRRKALMWWSCSASAFLRLGAFVRGIHVMDLEIPSEEELVEEIVLQIVEVVLDAFADIVPQRRGRRRGSSGARRRCFPASLCTVVPRRSGIEEERATDGEEAQSHRPGTGWRSSSMNGKRSSWLVSQSFSPRMLQRG